MAFLEQNHYTHTIATSLELFWAYLHFYARLSYLSGEKMVRLETDNKMLISPHPRPDPTYR